MQYFLVSLNPPRGWINVLPLTHSQRKLQDLILIGALLLYVYFFPMLLTSVSKKTSERCLDPNTGGKLKCQIRGIAVHRISKEIQGWQGKEQGGVWHTEQERRGHRGDQRGGGANNKGLDQTWHWHKPWSTFSWGDSRPPKHPFENVKKAK